MQPIHHSVFYIVAVFSLLLCTPLQAQEGAATPSPAPVSQLTEISRGFVSLAERVNPSVVQIFSLGYTPTQGKEASGAGLLSRRQSTGSGVILDESGYIVTNAHVVEGAQRVQVLMSHSGDAAGSPERSILRQRARLIGAQIVGMDKETDIAVLKIEGANLPALPIGDSDEVEQGQIVFAFGSPLGLENSVSMGVVSATARQLQPDAPMIYLQTDAVINPGNSGGPLVDTEGQVIGISTFILSQSGGSEGLGFAVPSNIMKTIYGQIRMTGRVRRGIIGTNVQTITPEMATALHLPQDWGVVVSDVHPGSPAEKAGLRIGDVVLTVNGKTMENGRQFNVNIYAHRVGEKVAVEVLRSDGKSTHQIAVVERKGDEYQLAEMVDPERNLISKLGILVIELDPQILKMLPDLRRKSGLVVASGTSDNPYWKERFQPGDVIYSINGTPITNLTDLRTAVGRLSPGDPVALQIERSGRLMYVAFNIR